MNLIGYLAKLQGLDMAFDSMLSGKRTCKRAYS